MARKRPHEEHVNAEAWAIPYADLMTLLLAFFVVMYALSTVNEGKYRAMADAMSTAFGGTPRAVSPIQPGEHPVRSQSGGRPTPIKLKPPLSLPERRRLVSTPSRELAASLRDQQQLARAQRQMDAVAQQLIEALSLMIDRKLIIVRRRELWIEVEINSDILFGTGSATLEQDARQTLNALAGVLRQTPNGVRVEGYTDDKPISTVQFPSNWELSAARAASVVHLFVEQGLQPWRLSMIGYGQFRPRADNRTEAGRNANRRVVLVILADGSQMPADTPAPQESASPAASVTAASVSTSTSAGPGHSRRAIPAAIEGER